MDEWLGVKVITFEAGKDVPCSASNPLANGNLWNFASSDVTAKFGTKTAPKPQRCGAFHSLQITLHTESTTDLRRNIFYRVAANLP